MPESTRLSGIPRQRISIDATEHQFAQWTFEEHCNTCASCGHAGDAYCPRGRALLALTAPAGDPDLPGYRTDLAYPAI